MAATLAFDIYGTLIDTAGVTESLRGMVGDQAPLFSSRWREKQLEYSFRRGLMGSYADFSVCTRDALAFTSEALGLPLTNQDRKRLLDEYRYLPAFAETAGALETLKAAGHRLYAFSNGLPDDLECLLGQAGIRPYFIDIVSVHEIRSFKPDPAVYRHFLQRSGAKPSGAWLISGNPFDVLGAMSAGMNAAWVERARAVFDPWGEEPTARIGSLLELAAVLE